MNNHLKLAIVGASGFVVSLQDIAFYLQLITAFTTATLGLYGVYRIFFPKKK